MHVDIDLGELCQRICEAASKFYKSHQDDMEEEVVEIIDETLSKEGKKSFERLFETKE